jgi:hypothetical protein
MRNKMQKGKVTTRATLLFIAFSVIASFAWNEIFDHINARNIAFIRAVLVVATGSFAALFVEIILSVAKKIQRRKK